MIEVPTTRGLDARTARTTGTYGSVCIYMCMYMYRSPTHMYMYLSSSHVANPPHPPTPPHPLTTTPGAGPAVALVILGSVALTVTSLYTLHCYTLGCKLARQPVPGYVRTF